MKRSEHQAADTYPHWRPALLAAYDQAKAAHMASLPTAQDREQDYIKRSIAYEHWCRSSPEWAEIKKRIFWRSRGHCESCLAGNAEVVHHITYSFGKLPPAWHLKAVCTECHERLHTAGDDWCDYGMARG